MVRTLQAVVLGDSDFADAVKDHDYLLAMVDYSGGRDLDSLIKFMENDGKEVAEEEEEDEEEEDIEEEEDTAGHDEL